MPKPLLHIIPARFRIDEAYLSGYQVAVMDFPFRQAVDAFLGSIKQLRNGKDLEYDELPPYRRLNTVLLALSPSLIHAFEEHQDPETKRKVRQALVLATEPRPTLEQIGRVVQVWAQQWIEQCFSAEIQGAAGEAYSSFLTRLKHPDEDWRTVDARLLLSNLNAEKRLSYRALPSLLAALVARQSSEVNGRMIQWHLAHDGDRYIVVSDPFLSSFEEYGKQYEGTFAYKLEFHLQTQIGNPHPWIHLYVRCRRYADKEIETFNWRRDVSVMVGIDQPRLEGWRQSPTFITIPLTGGAKKPQWLDNLTELLTAMKARKLIEPSDLVQDPLKYRAPSPVTNFDRYYVVYAEGLDPKHGVKTGFDLYERGEVVEAVASSLGLKVSLGETLAPDEEAHLTRLSRPLAMFNSSDLAVKKFISKQGCGPLASTRM